jgi:taurine dioxygenase
MEEHLVDFTKLSKHTGVEVHGVDLRDDLPASTIAELRRLFVENCVILFRNQTLTQQQLVRATGFFGEVANYDRPLDLQTEQQKRQLPQVMLITNIREDGKPIGALPDGEMWFHHDMIHNERPHKATMLYSIEIPTWGGNTVFSNLFAAHDEMPHDLRSKLDGRMALNAFNYGARFKGDPEAMKTRKQAIHPAIRVHEETGRKAVYVDRLMTQQLIGLPDDESEAVLERVFDFIEREEFCYEHVWRKGDVLLWDNRSSIHARRDFPADQIRLMWRTTLVGAPVKVAEPA